MTKAKLIKEIYDAIFASTKWRRLKGHKGMYIRISELSDIWFSVTKT